MTVVGSLRQASWDGLNQLPVPKPSHPTVRSRGHLALLGASSRKKLRGPFVPKLFYNTLASSCLKTSCQQGVAETLKIE